MLKKYFRIVVKFVFSVLTDAENSMGVIAMTVVIGEEELFNNFCE